MIIFVMSSTRLLAAMMFTDIVGYTALMGEDGQKAFALLQKNRQMQKSLIEQFNGKWIKELGDGVLASFSTVTDAAQCALAIQQACKQVTKQYNLPICAELIGFRHIIPCEFLRVPDRICNFKFILNKFINN
jgi:hypothetical protein